MAKEKKIYIVDDDRNIVAHFVTSGETETDPLTQRVTWPLPCRRWLTIASLTLGIPAGPGVRRMR